MKKSNHIFLFNIIFYIFIIFSLLNIMFPKYSKIDINKSYYEGILTNYNIKNNKLIFEINGKEKIIGNYKISKKDKIKKLKLGLKIKVVGSFSLPNKNTIPNTFNYKRYLKSKKIYYTMNVSKITILDEPSIFYKFKNYIVNVINKKRLKNYYYIFILGDKNYLDENIYNVYKNNGIAHLFAISGMHISIIVFALKKIKINNKIILLFLYFYSFLVMFTPSVLRVTIFYSLKNIKLFKNVNNIKLLILTASILIIYNSNIIYDIGFLYTFIITLGLFLLKPKGIIKLSIYSFLFSIPITLYNNYEMNILSIIINIIIVPFVSTLVFPIMIISLFIPILEPLVVILVYALEYTNFILSKFSLNILIGKPLIFEITIYYFILYLYTKNKYKFLIILLLLIISLSKFKLSIDNYYVYYLDIGQGDSSVIISPNKKETIMIDTGGHINSNYLESKNTMLFLKSLGIDKINILVLTHGDFDHMGEAINLVNNFKVEKVIFNCGPYNDLEKELIKVLNKKKIRYYSCIKELTIDNNKLYFLQTREYDNENDNSNVIYTELNGYKFMFMGDAGVEKEKDILQKYNISDIDVLKVGHHGSKTSSSKEFIDEINPKYSIISVGKNNRYGHPNKEVLNNLEDSKTYRTDQDGSIMFKIKNNKLEIETCSP